MTVKELYESAIREEMSELAHCIHHLLSEGKISLDDDSKDIDYSQINIETVVQMVKENVLGFNPMKIFSLKYSDVRYVFIYAKDKQQAKEHFKKLFRKEPMNCIEMYMDERMTVGNRVVTFREYRKEFEHFPAFAGIYEKLI